MTNQYYKITINNPGFWTESNIPCKFIFNSFIKNYTNYSIHDPWIFYFKCNKDISDYELLKNCKKQLLNFAEEEINSEFCPIQRISFSKYKIEKIDIISEIENRFRIVII